MNSIVSQLQNWVSNESMAALWLVVSGVALTAATYRDWRGQDQGFWGWARRLGQALGNLLLFVGIVGIFVVLLTNDFYSFNKIHASFTSTDSTSRANWMVWRKSYGGRLVQRDLIVTQFIKKETVEAIPSSEPNGQVLYRNIVAEEPLGQDSITAFQGKVTMNLVNRENQLQTFNAYTLSAIYEYDVVNPVDFETRAQFEFPLMLDAGPYEHISIKVDGVEAPWLADQGFIIWDAQMLPAQKRRISISYDVRGMDGYVFEAPDQREVTDFTLTVALDTDNC